MSRDMHSANPGFALGQWLRACDTAAHHPDPDTRRRARERAERWRDIIHSMQTGKLTVGSRTPLSDTPAWVTLEVARGGFATGRYLAEAPLEQHEQELLASLPRSVPGSTDRERLNLWYLGEEGQRELASVLAERRYRLGLPEEGALLVVTWLLANDHADEALELVATLRPLMHRLRFYPTVLDSPRPAEPTIVVRTVGQVRSSLERVTDSDDVQAMREALTTWNPLFDRLVELWSETVEDDLPQLERDAEGSLLRRSDGQPIVIGGWPCRRWPEDWSALRLAWLDDYRRARREHSLCGKHRHPRSNFTRLREALERCPHDSRKLDGRDVGLLRRTLANTLTRHGGPESEQRQNLRATQAAIAALPGLSAFAEVLNRRLSVFPETGGVTEPATIEATIRPDESERIAEGTELPEALVAKTRRALEAPMEELLERGIITSSETLARVLPQLTSHAMATGFDDPGLTTLCQQLHEAFRRRRSLLLLNLERQVQLEELPWFPPLERRRSNALDLSAATRDVLEQVTLTTLLAFPHALLPNRLIRELGALAERAGMKLPLVEEIAADIFMGAFTNKWRFAAQRTYRSMEGSLYARYYDLPPPVTRKQVTPTTPRGANTLEAFLELCRERSREAGDPDTRRVSSNGIVLEQAQVLTTHDLAVLVSALELEPTLREHGRELVERIFGWLVTRQLPKWRHTESRRDVKNGAFAWRQAIYFLSLLDGSTQDELITGLEQLVSKREPEEVALFWPVVIGLRGVHGGQSFDAAGRLIHDGHQGRRWFGWSVRRHWLLETPTEAGK
ncbi:MAG: hypothetical protein AAF533_18915 [Acidobacteriota bacterium]